jgi:hypothetical protein
MNSGKLLFFWVSPTQWVSPSEGIDLSSKIRYYGIALLMFDVVQIHVFAIPGITNDNLYVPPQTFSPHRSLLNGFQTHSRCVAMDSIIRVVGALNLWVIEIVMQMRIYAIYGCSRRVYILFIPNQRRLIVFGLVDR